jgi:O-antigen/teichoic acid export membrane protein
MERGGGEVVTAQRGFLFNVNLVFAGTVVNAAVSFTIAVLLARALGPEGRGVTSLYQSAVNVGFMVLSLGLGAAAVYFVARRDLTPRKALEVGLSLTLLAAAASALGVLATYLLFGDRLADEDVPYWLAAVAVPAAVQFRSVEAVLQAQGRFAAFNAMGLSLGLTALVSLAAVELTSGLDVSRTVVVWSFAFVPPALLGYVLAGRDAWPRRLAGLRTLRQVAGFGMQGQVSNLVQLLNYRLDSYLVLIFVGASGVGLYAIGVQLSEGLWFIANSVSLVLLTNLTAGDEEYGARTTPIVCRGTLLVSGLAALGAAGVAPFFIPAVFGEAFEGAVLPFILLLPGAVALAGTKVLASYVFSRGRPLVNGGIAAAALAVAVGADLALIPVWEVEGAAIGATLGYLVSLALTAIAYRRLSGGSLAEALLPRISDLSLYHHEAKALAARLPFLGRPVPEP